MKKFTAILLTVLMIASLFISCENKITPVSDETVSVSFDESTSRSLTASLDQFDANNYYWAYKATKTDSTGLTSGQTEFAWVKSGSEAPSEGKYGLKDVKIPGFSQGAWEFELYAYTTNSKTDANGDSTMAYTGKTNVVLTKGAENKVSVTVSPISAGNGTLVVNISNIKIEKADGTVLGDNDQANFVKEVTINPIATDGEIPEIKTGVNYTYDAKPGAYKVNVALQQDGIIFASGSVVATVYSNITTTVSGKLREQITDASFDPSQNPDVMNLVASSNSIDLANVVDDSKIQLNSVIPEGETESKINAEVEAKAGKDLITELKKVDGAGSAELKAASSHEIALALSVDTTSASENAVSYEISLSSTITSKDSNGNVTATEVYHVSELTKYLTAEIKLQQGLTNVIVTHNNHEMKKLDSVDQIFTEDEAPYGAYFYDSTSGSLTIKTKSFSPFQVTYSKFVAEMNGRKFASLQDAVNVASDNDIISVLEDYTLSSSILIDNGKTFTIDFGGHTIEGTIKLKSGFVSLSNGEISHSYCPIYVYTTNTDIVYNSLTIEDNMTVTGGEKTYGLIVYQNSVGEYNYGSTVNIKGKIKDVNSILFVMGNIKTNLDTAVNPVRINILDNAELSTINNQGGGISENGSAIITVSGNPTIKGHLFAIEVRAGKLEIEGGTFISTATPSESDSNSSGSSTSGAAIAISQHQTTLPIYANISDGNFSGYTAFYQSSPETNSDSTKLNLSITGGTFVSTNDSENAVAVYSEDCTQFINGGVFSVNPNITYITEDYTSVKNGDFWIVKKAPSIKIGEQKYSTMEEAVQAAQEGDVIILGEGEYSTYGSKYAWNKKLSFKGQGADKTTWLIGHDQVISGEGGADYSLEGATVSFSDMTIQDKQNNANYRGFVRCSSLSFNNCEFNSRESYWGVGTVSFSNCKFNDTGDWNLWCYSGHEFIFDKCKFISSNKGAINFYQENTGNQVSVTVKDCNFILNNENSIDKPIIQIGEDYTDKNQFTLVISNVQIEGNYANGDFSEYPKYVLNKNNKSPEKLRISIDGNLVYGIQETSF